MGDDEEAGVEWTEASRQGELTYAWEVVVYSGYVPVPTLHGTCCGDFFLPIRRRQFACLSQVVFEGLVHVWSLVSCRNEQDEASPPWSGGS